MWFCCQDALMPQVSRDMEHWMRNELHFTEVVPFFRTPGMYEGPGIRAFLNCCVRLHLFFEQHLNSIWMALVNAQSVIVVPRVVREVLCWWWLLSDVLCSCWSTLGRGCLNTKKNYRYIQYVRLIQVRKLSEIGWTVMTTNVAGGHQSYLFSLVGDTLSSGNGCGWYPAATLHANRGRKLRQQWQV